MLTLDSAFVLLSFSSFYLQPLDLDRWNPYWISIGRVYLFKDNHMENHNTDELFNRGNINFVKVAEKIAKDHNLIYSANKFYEFHNGCYQQVKTNILRQWVHSILGEKTNTFKVNEVVNLIRDNYFVDSENELNKTNLLNLKNGMLDVDTLTLTPHDPGIYSTVQLDVAFDKESKCPKWQKTINEIFEGSEVKVNLLQEFFGLCFTRVTKYEKCLFCIGEGANGKSMLIAVLESLIGKENCCAIPLECFTNRHYLARLHGKMLNISTETNAKTNIEENILKAFTTGDPVEVDLKFEQSFSFRPFCKLIFAVNNMPRVDDKTDSYFRRLLILRFEKSFGEKERNPNLIGELLKERDGIFLWALKGYQRLARRGYFEPDEVVQAEVLDYKKENNNVLVFVEQKCQVKNGLSIPMGELYTIYQTWCGENGVHALSSIKFSKELRRQFPAVQKGRDSAKWFWLNIDVLSKPPVNTNL